MNVIFQVIQNILRRKEQQGRCPSCGDPLPPRAAPDKTGDPDDTDAQNSGAHRCPSCGRPLPGDDTR